MGVCQFHLDLIAVHPYQVNSFHSISLPNSGSFHTYLDHLMSISDISDLKVQARLQEGAALHFNMDTTCFRSVQNMYYLAFKQHGLLYHLVELLHLMCSSLWNISFVLELHFHWNLEIFVMLKHVIYHVYHQPLCNVFRKELFKS